MTKSRYYVVLITAGSRKEADRISSGLVKEKLAACVNIFPRIHSRYWWKGKVETGAECLLIAKTKKNLIQRLIRKVKSLHSYAVPETIALPIAAGNSEYLNWIEKSI